MTGDGSQFHHFNPEMKWIMEWHHKTSQEEKGNVTGIVPLDAEGCILVDFLQGQLL
jgi:hypothetical protein